MTFKLLIYILIIKPITNLALISLQTYVTKLNILVRLLISLFIDGLGCINALFFLWILYIFFLIDYICIYITIVY
jgi:hypothetical protein